MAEAEEQGKTEAAQTEEGQKEVSLLDQIIGEGRWREEEDKERARDLIGDFARQVMDKSITVSKDTLKMVNNRIADIDKLISKQLNEVMHTSEFQKLEGSWRGLSYLVQKSETGERLKIRVMNVSKKDLLKDMESASEFDQSTLFKKVYEEEFGMYGGESYGAMIGDYEFSNHPQDVLLLEQISGVAAASHTPFISAASPRLFGWDSFTELQNPRDMAMNFKSVEYAKWKSFRDSEDSRYVALTLPHILTRLPYGEANVPVEMFNFEEDVTGKDHSKYLWSNAAYALGARITDAFAQYGWTVAIRGHEGGGLVEGLPSHTFSTDDGEVAQKCPTEIAITDRREKEIADLGFIPLVHCKNTDKASFFSTQTTNKPKLYDSDAANANARLSSQLQYILAASRFAHYVKAIMREKIGKFMTRQEAESYLNKWITGYVLLDDNAGQELKAKFPLREAQVNVKEIPGKTGAYQAIAWLKPHYQLDEIDVSLRLVADLPPSAK